MRARTTHHAPRTTHDTNIDYLTSQTLKYDVNPPCKHANINIMSIIRVQSMDDGIVNFNS
jgi:hypothetical protein